ncbi:ECF transporter S component [Pseudalkalibacillus sp. Hm43]|uniref:ECF transporter S component n=1 Tax=Pseudalkalibacillus sp. Hm43 TaxID=3450742 RepID=UPI003F42A7BD
MRTKIISLVALFTAFSAIGGAIKIPAVIGSIGLDTFPALMAGMLIGSIPGAIVAGIGHLISALFGGMPLGPFHVLISLEMAFFVYLFSGLYQRGIKRLACVVFVCGNALLAPLPFIWIIGASFYTAIVPSLLLSAVVNTILAVISVHKGANMFNKSPMKEWSS